MKRAIFFILGAITLFASCQKEIGSEKDVRTSDKESCQIGFYHNEILKNFIEISQQPSALSSSTGADEFKKLMADYGSAVYLAYKRNPPSSNLDQWVGNVLEMSVSTRQSKILDNIISKKMTLTNALNNGFGRNVVPEIISNYLADIERITANYGGTATFNTKLTQLHLQYYRQATSDERMLVSWITDVAEGSYDYWDGEYRTWYPRLTRSKFWDKTLKIGATIVGADIGGVVSYFIERRYGWVTAALSWKVGAAYAGLHSAVAGVATLTQEIITRAPIENISSEEIYEAYLFRKNELGL